jgi:hypothetical protein
LSDGLRRMIIRNILILTVIAALVPTAMSTVSTSAASEIALFSSDSDSLSISGNGDNAKMILKATNENGKTKKVSDFQMNADNVLNIKVGDTVTVKDKVDFTKAITTDGNNNQKVIGITSNGVIDFTGYTQGVSTLDVVVNDDRAYEAIIVIGQQPPDVINKQVTKVNNNQETRIQFVYPDPKCDEGEKLINGKCVPVDSCGCPIGENCPAMVCEPIPCDEGFYREGDECIPNPDTCMGGGPGVDGCPPVEPEPEPIECDEGEELVDGQCQLISTNPVELDDPLPSDGNEGDNNDESDDSDDGDSGDDNGDSEDEADASEGQDSGGTSE